MTELNKCSGCKTNKKIEFFSVRINTGERYKTCKTCRERSFKCDIDDCKYKSSRKGDVDVHIKRKHTNIKDYKCDYEGCEYECCTSSDLNKHVKQVHEKNGEFKCNICPFECCIKSVLKRHINTVHENIKDFKCDYEGCEYECCTSSDLNKHIKSVHDKIKDFNCDECTYKCSQKECLTRHQKRCTGEMNISSGEFQVIKALSDLGFEEGIDYYNNISFHELTTWSNKHLRFDFRFINHKIVIEYDGEQHCRPIRFGGISQDRAEASFKAQQIKDKLKDNFCKENGYKMIRISYKDFSKVLEILSGELFDIVNWIG